MRNIIIILTMTAGFVAAVMSLKKSDRNLAGYVIADSNKMEAAWYPDKSGGD